MSDFQDLGIKEVKVHRTTAQKKNARKQKVEEITSQQNVNIC